MIPKYRAWHKKEKKMFIVESIDFLAKHEMGGYSRCGGEETGDKPSHITICEFETYRGIGRFDADKLILLQSTGLKDKNGKEIFEGDILKDSDNNIWTVNLGHFKEYDHSHYGWWIKPIFDTKLKFKVNPKQGSSITDRIIVFIELKVIGNIYENPKLLKEKVMSYAKH